VLLTDYAAKTNRKAHSSIQYFNSIFKLLTSSTYFKTRGFTLGKTVVNAVFCGLFYMQWCKQ